MCAMWAEQGWPCQSAFTTAPALVAGKRAANIGPRLTLKGKNQNSIDFHGKQLKHLVQSIHTCKGTFAPSESKKIFLHGFV
jgi:hypothetical protein